MLSVGTLVRFNRVGSKVQVSMEYHLKHLKQMFDCFFIHKCRHSEKF